MISFYQLLYYELYFIWKRKTDEVENARINAVITLTFSLFANGLSFVLILLIFFEIDLIPDLAKGQFHLFIGLPLIMIGVINWFALGRSEAHQKIQEKFEESSLFIQKCASKIVWFYLLISFGIPMFIFSFFEPH